MQTDHCTLSEHTKEMDWRIRFISPYCTRICYKGVSLKFFGVFCNWQAAIGSFRGNKEGFWIQVLQRLWDKFWVWESISSLHKLPYIQVHLEGNKDTSNGSANPVNTGGSNNIDLVVINQPLASLKPKAKSKHLPMLLLAAQRPGGGIN